MTGLNSEFNRKGPNTLPIWGLSVGLITNIIVVAYGYGKLQEKVETLSRDNINIVAFTERMARMEVQITAIREAVSDLKDDARK